MRLALTLFALLATACLSNAWAALDERAVAAWSDREIGRLIAEQERSGAIIAIVHGSTIVLSKGYGYENHKSGRLINTKTSQILLGSLSKPFIAVAIMQLYERGRIESLDDPVNKYFKRIQIPQPEGSILTVRHLLTARSGFANGIYGFGYINEMPLPVAAEFIREILPPFVVEPGEPGDNSTNLEAALLCLMVEDITGLAFSEYIKQQIFLPAGMNNSRWNHFPVTYPDVAAAYVINADGSYRPMEHERVSPIYANALIGSASADDIAAFMSHSLATPTQGQTAMLPAEAFNQIHDPQYYNSGMFYRNKFRGEVRIIATGGLYGGSNTELWMLPEKKTGIFIGVLGENPDKKSVNPSALIDKFLLEFEIAPGTTFAEDSNVAPAPDEYLGYYVVGSGHDLTRATDINAIINLFPPKTKKWIHQVRREGKDIYLDDERMIPIGDQQYYGDKTGRLLGFRHSASNVIQIMNVERGGIIAEKIRYPYFAFLYDLKVIHNLMWWLLWLGISGSLALFWSRSIKSTMGRTLQMSMLGAFIICLLIAGLLSLGYEDGESIRTDLWNRELTRIHLLHALGNVLLIIAPLAAALAIKYSLSADNKLVTVMVKLHAVLVALALCILAVILIKHSLVGFSIP